MIPIHNKELSTQGIEMLPFKDLSQGPAVPHRDDHYMFILQQKGRSCWTIDFKQWTVEGVSICFVAPGQVHQCLLNEEAKCWMLFVEPKLIPTEYRTMMDSFMYNRQVISLQPDHPVFTLAAILYDFIEQGEQIFYQSILHAQVNALIGYLTAAFVPQSQIHKKTGSHKYLLVTMFKNLISQQFKEVKQVKDYAEQLHITPLYLNEVSKEITGFTASYWIQNEVLLEAQRLLFYTNMDVKEIAFSLGYEDHTYFTRFFKKNLGCTAGQFRQNNHHLSNHMHE
ncbi:helix-turn-helix domain-containing protein [Sphingobacterium ginsenosidimutans]|uniref:AraC family transcriptional regulator n=2 Tax=Sphingobacterium TaxID=28453 RepID=A0ABP8ADI6_9SPHI